MKILTFYGIQAAIAAPVFLCSSAGFGEKTLLLLAFIGLATFVLAYRGNSDMQDKKTKPWLSENNYKFLAYTTGAMIFLLFMKVANQC